MGIPWTSKNSYLFLYLKNIKELYLKAMQNVMYHYTHLDVAERVNVYRKRRGVYPPTMNVDHGNRRGLKKNPEVFQIFLKGLP